MHEDVVRCGLAERHLRGIMMPFVGLNDKEGLHTSSFRLRQHGTFFFSVSFRPQRENDTTKGKIRRKIQNSKIAMKGQQDSAPSSLLDGKFAIVTGCDGVLGGAMARGLAAAGPRRGILGRLAELAAPGGGIRSCKAARGDAAGGRL